MMRFYRTTQFLNFTFEFHINVIDVTFFIFVSIFVFVFHVIHVSPFLHTCYLRLEASRDHREDHKAAAIAIKLPIPAFAISKFVKYANTRNFR